MRQVLQLQEEDFGTGVYSLDVFIYWGVEGIDTSETSMWAPWYIGEVIFDRNFSLYSVEAQQSLLDLCVDLREQPFIKEGTEVLCWTDAFQLEVESMPISDPDDFKAKLHTWATSTVTGS